MDKINSNELLNQLQVLARKVQETNTQSTSDNGISQPSEFSELMKDSINKVNDQQMKAGGMTKAFEMNDPDIPLSSLMIEILRAPFLAAERRDSEAGRRED